MTRNEIAYQQFVENRRSNMANERETNRSNVAREAETYRSNTAKEFETNRHNLATEDLGYKNYEETKRHNFSMEDLGFAQLGLGYSQLGETRQHNRTTETLSQLSNIEQQRANREREAETHRANVAREFQNAAEQSWRHNLSYDQLGQQLGLSLLDAGSKYGGTGLNAALGVLKNVTKGKGRLR